MLVPKKWSLFAFLLVLFSFHSNASKLILTTWNLEWLSSSPSVQFSASQRNKVDYLALSGHFEKIGSDVLAFQEVNDPTALQRITGQDYQLFFSDRSRVNNKHHQFEDINQYTGFAVRKEVNVLNKPDLRLDDHHQSKLRFASYIVINSDSEQPVHALAVHLKARCSGAYRNTRDCKILKQQGKALNLWLQERERNNDSYIVLGDFNHNLSYRGDWLWQDIISATNGRLASKRSQAVCKVKSRNNPTKTHQFRSLIDHIIVSEDLITSTPKQNVFPVSEVLKYQLSDHCPLSMELY